MYIFSRRAIQQFLDALRDTISDKQLQGLVSRLNQPGRQRLSDVWEVALLYALSRVGNVQHEVQLADGHRPDVTFSYPQSVQPWLIADVTTVSDFGAEKENPIEPLTDEICRLARASRINANHLQIIVRGKQDGKIGHSRMRLLLPRRGDFPKTLAATIVPFFAEIRQKDLSEHRVDIEEDGVSFSVGFNKAQKFLSLNYPVYDVTLSLRKNPLRARLEDKLDQLRAVPPPTLKGIFACDGGARIMSEKWRAPTEFSADDVVTDVLRQNASLDFVTLVSVENAERSVRDKYFWLLTRTWVSARALGDRRLQSVIKKAVDCLPNPVLDPLNSSIQCRYKDYGRGYLGAFGLGFGRHASHIRVPARALLELLAGRMTTAEFLDAFEWKDDGSSRREFQNPFKRMIDGGHMITGIRVDAGKNQADDWLQFEFGNPDPAISPFIVRQKADDES